MKDEKTSDVLRVVKRNFSVYTAILAIVFFLIKLFLNKRVTIFELMPDFVLLIGFFITAITMPRDRIKDEHITKKANEHYNKAFKIILPIMIITFIVSKILIIKTNSVINIPTTLYINSFFLLIFVGIIIAVRQHNIYLNEKFLESKTYFANIFKIIAYIFVICLASAIVGMLFDFIILGEKSSSLTFILMFGSLFINLSVHYFLYSIYEYNHYKESSKLLEGKLFIVTKNMFLYLGINMFLTTLSRVYHFFVYVQIHFFQPHNLDNFLKLSSIFRYIRLAETIYGFIFLIIITFSLKESLLRLKESSFSFINKATIFTVIYLIIAALVIIIPNLLTPSLSSNSYSRAVLSFLLSNIMSFILVSFYLIIIIMRFLYAKKQNFPSHKLLLIPIVSSLISNLLGISENFLAKVFRDYDKAVLVVIIVSFILSIIVFINYLYIVSVYSKTYELVDKKQETTVFI